MLRFPFTPTTTLLAPTSRLGQFINRKTSWTLPDTRPKRPLVERGSSSFLTQMRISAEVFHRDAIRDSRNAEEGGGVKKRKIVERGSAPGRVARISRYDFSEQHSGMTRRSVRKFSKHGQKFDNWNS